MRQFTTTLSAALALTFLAGTASAGTFIAPSHRPNHPGYAYFGVSGRVDIPLCPSNADLERLTKNVAAAYNRRDETLGNYVNDIGDPQLAPQGTFDMQTVILHELGHGLGLGHIDLTTWANGGVSPAPGVPFSYPGPNGVYNIDAGPDGKYGTEDDERGDDLNATPFPLSPGNSVFHVPAIVDDASMTTDRALRDNPGTWPEASTVTVANERGLPPTFSAMLTQYSGAAKRPSPDELTLVKWAESGADGINGNEDDYELFLYVVPWTTPLNDLPPNCAFISLSNSTDFGSTLARARPRGFLATLTYDCFGDKLCRPIYDLELNAAVNWHINQVDTSNGEADFVPLEPSDVTIVAPAAISVNRGLSESFAFSITRDGGIAFDQGTLTRVATRNGVVSCVNVGTGCMPPGQIDVSGLTELAGTITVQADNTPSTDGLFISVFAPNKPVEQARVEVTDLGDATLLTFAPSAIQFPTDLNELPLFGSEPPLEVPVEGFVFLSGSGSGIPDVEVFTVGSLCNATGQGAVFVRGQGGITNASGLFTMDFELYEDGTNDPVQVEATCLYEIVTTEGNVTESVRLTTDQIAGTITLNPNMIQLDPSEQVAGIMRTVDLDLSDQLGDVFEGAELSLECEPPPEGGLGVAGSMLTTDAAGEGQFTLTTVAGAPGQGLTLPITCAVEKDGVRAEVVVDGVRTETILASPDSRFLSRVEMVHGHQESVTFTLLDGAASPMVGKAVTATCTTSVLNSIEFQPDAPATRSTDASGEVTFTLTAYTDAGMFAAINVPITCSIEADGQQGSITITGEVPPNPIIFTEGFE